MLFHITYTTTAGDTHYQQWVGYREHAALQARELAALTDIVTVKLSDNQDNLIPF